MNRLPPEVIFDVENRTFKVIIAELIMKSELYIQPYLVLEDESRLAAQLLMPPFASSLAFFNFLFFKHLPSPIKSHLEFISANRPSLFYFAHDVGMLETFF
jgi:hypothetical protein